MSSLAALPANCPVQPSPTVQSDSIRMPSANFAVFTTSLRLFIGGSPRSSWQLHLRTMLLDKAGEAGHEVRPVGRQCRPGIVQRVRRQQVLGHRSGEANVQDGMPPTEGHEDRLPRPLNTLKHPELLRRSGFPEGRQGVQPPVRRWLRIAAHGPATGANAAAVLLRIARGKQDPPLQAAQQGVPSGRAGGVHVQVRARALDPDHVVPVQREERPRVLRQVVEVVPEVGGGRKVLEQRQPRTLEVALEHVEGEVRADLFGVLNVQPQWQLNLQGLAACVGWDDFGDLEAHVTIMIQELLP
mmetsp:Transcript_88369/g.279638  ORF Transcript_88369/g.279638 Transcript_88369/m.279638 type:complete len:299 (-) Transcript_88369:595-1491(-)